MMDEILMPLPAKDGRLIQYQDGLRDEGHENHAGLVNRQPILPLMKHYCPQPRGPEE